MTVCATTDEGPGVMVGSTEFDCAAACFLVAALPASAGFKKGMAAYRRGYSGQPEIM